MEFDIKALRPYMRKLFISLNLPIVYFLELLRISLKFDNQPWEIVEKNRPVLLALYHGELLPILLYGAHRGNIATIVSKHTDGEIIANVLKRLGYRTIRGSTDSGRNKGGSAAIKGVFEALEKGYHVAITVDGPKGPCCKVKDGILYASAISQRPIYPVRVKVKGFRLPSWDRFSIPLPFSKVEIILGKPILVKDKENLNHYRRLLEEELTRLV